MTPDTVVQLGEIAFDRTEVPERLPFGGQQTLDEKRLIGGKKVADAMGWEVAPIAWEGVFFGKEAEARARSVEAIAVAGVAVELSWSTFRYKVIVQRFDGDFRRFYHVPYSILCVVIEDLASPASAPAGPTVDDMMASDMSDAKKLGAAIGDGPLNSALGVLDKAVAGVSNFATAAQGALSSVLAPLAEVQGRVETLISTVSNTVTNVATLGGIVPNNPVAAMVSKFTDQVAAFGQLPQLYDLQNVLGRMETNLGNVRVAGSEVLMAGGDLFSLAASEFGSATEWSAIARANGLTDPFLTGINRILVPAAPEGADGVLTV